MKKIEIKGRVVALLRDTGEFLISSEVFSGLSNDDRTQLFAESSGKDLRFVSNFNSCTNIPGILEALKKGEDVSLELEYQELSIEKAHLDLIREYSRVITEVITPLVRSKLPPYPYAEMPSSGVLGITTSPDGRHAIRSGHKWPMRKAKAVFLKAARGWAGIIKKMPSSCYEEGNYVYFYSDRITIGCQTITRYEIEQFALEMGWEFPSKLDK